MQSVAGCCAQMFGPVAQMTQNTKYYSGKAPPPLRTRNLPHVTIQCPVYKEGLQAVLVPTVNSLKAAMAEYEMQGGSVSIFVNDDGMQLISEEEAQARRDYYAENQIGWVARPKHNPKPAPGEEGFIRPGKFKKASNMNYAMAVSARIEDKMTRVQRHEKWTKEDENFAYRQCLEQVKVEDQGRTWADGNIRIGDYILLIDCDTRVPQKMLPLRRQRAGTLPRSRNPPIFLWRYERRFQVLRNGHRLLHKPHLHRNPLRRRKWRRRPFCRS